MASHQLETLIPNKPATLSRESCAHLASPPAESPSIEHPIGGPIERAWHFCAHVASIRAPMINQEPNPDIFALQSRGAFVCSAAASAAQTLKPHEP